MTPLPKRKHSTRRKGKRLASRKRVLAQIVTCKHCGKPKLPHRTCHSCGKK